MANIKSAKKRAKQSEVKRVRNAARRTSVKSAIKKVMVAVKNSDKAGAQELLRDAEAKIARARGKGLFHRNTAARKISVIAKEVARIER